MKNADLFFTIPAQVLFGTARQYVPLVAVIVLSLA
jgi:hypothetical protein